MMTVPTPELAERVVRSVEPDGQLTDLNVPLYVIDPGSLRFWVAHVLGDAALADALACSRPADAAALLASRRAECSRMMCGRVASA